MIIKNPKLDNEDSYTSKDGLFHIQSKHDPVCPLVLLINERMIIYPHGCTIVLDKDERIDFDGRFYVQSNQE
jgi:hypothetical protein